MSYAQPISHIPFILKPASDILKEAMSSLNAANGGIETYPICGYLLHSLFLKLTGSQEQKLKCICWELACRDYEYRYERFEQKRYSECSSYEDKKMVYNDLVNAISKIDDSFTVDNALRDSILASWRYEIGQIFSNSLIIHGFRKSYERYESFQSRITRDWIMRDTMLFVEKSNIPVAQMAGTCNISLQEIYKNYVYRERNRCAHNTRSYQHNLPTLKVMAADDYKLHNYFLFMSVIVLLDEIFVKLFEIYLEKMK